jgi:hypothetical protein
MTKHQLKLLQKLPFQIMAVLVCLATHSAKPAQAEDFRVRAFSRSEVPDPSEGSWTNTGSLNAGRSAHTATLLTNGLVLVAGGVGIAELYDEATGVWTVTMPANFLRFQHTATLLTNGLVLVAGGYDGLRSFQAPNFTTRPRPDGR